MVKIYNYIDAGDFANFVESDFGIKSRKVYDILLEKDYIEGRLGSIFSYGDEEYADEELQMWFNTFMERYNIIEIQLKY